MLLSELTEETYVYVYAMSIASHSYADAINQTILYLDYLLSAACE